LLSQLFFDIVSLLAHFFYLFLCGAVFINLLLFFACSLPGSLLPDPPTPWSIISPERTRRIHALHCPDAPSPTPIAPTSHPPFVLCFSPRSPVCFHNISFLQVTFPPSFYCLPLLFSFLLFLLRFSEIPTMVLVLLTFYPDITFIVFFSFSPLPAPSTLVFLFSQQSSCFLCALPQYYPGIVFMVLCADGLFL